MLIFCFLDLKQSFLLGRGIYDDDNNNNNHNNNNNTNNNNNNANNSDIKKPVPARASRDSFRQNRAIEADHLCAG
jgi:hypothetical protein